MTEGLKRKNTKLPKKQTDKRALPVVRFAGLKAQISLTGFVV
jgi:hypothetical protein